MRWLLDLLLHPYLLAFLFGLALGELLRLLQAGRDGEE